MSAARRLLRAALLAAAALAATVPPPASAQPRRADAASAHQYFTDLALVDQEGRSHRLYSDLLRGKVVVVNSFFTNCTASCPVVMGRMTGIQRELGERLGREVYLLSLTSDPATDTPARLREYGTRLGARPGWYLLTGAPDNVKLALRKLGHGAESREAHPNLIVVGNERTGLWKKLFALAARDELVRLVETVLEDR